MDFRSQDGLTALHKAVKANNHVALKVNNMQIHSITQYALHIDWMHFSNARQGKEICILFDAFKRWLIK